MIKDEIDRKIVRLLQSDGTLSQTALAEKVGASAASCWRRVRALEEKGVLGATVRLADPELLGLGINVLCHVRLKNHLPNTSTVFESFLRNSREILECYAMTGDWDYLIRVVVSDVAAYQEFLRTRLLTNAAVMTASSSFALAQVKYTTALPI